MTERDAAVIEAAAKMLEAASAMVEGRDSILADDIIDLLHESDANATADAADRAFARLRCHCHELRAALGFQDAKELAKAGNRPG